MSDDCFVNTSHNIESAAVSAFQMLKASLKIVGSILDLQYHLGLEKLLTLPTDVQNKRTLHFCLLKYDALYGCPSYSLQKLLVGRVNSKLYVHKYL